MNGSTDSKDSKILDPMERSLATCLGLDPEQQKKVIDSQRSGNTAPFEDIAITLNLVTREQTNKCLHRQGPKGFLRAHPSFVLHSTQLLIAVCALASLVVSLMPERRDTTLTVYAVPSVNLEGPRADGSYSFAGYRLNLEGSIPSSGSEDKIAIVVVHESGETTPRGCIVGSGTYQSLKFGLARGESGERERAIYENGIGQISITEMTIDSRITWDLDSLGFDRNCNRKRDMPRIHVKGASCKTPGIPLVADGCP